jgi:hypothetical protein
MRIDRTLIGEFDGFPSACLGWKTLFADQCGSAVTHPRRHHEDMPRSMPCSRGLVNTFLRGPFRPAAPCADSFRRFIGKTTKNIRRIGRELKSRQQGAVSIPRLPGAPENGCARKKVSRSDMPRGTPSKGGQTACGACPKSRREGVRVVSEARKRRIEPTLAIRGSWFRGRSKRIRKKGLFMLDLPHVRWARPGLPVRLQRILRAQS